MKEEQKLGLPEEPSGAPIEALPPSAMGSGEEAALDYLRRAIYPS